MARTNNLTNFLNDVSSAIKQKTGDNTPIPASEFDTEILNIETKGEYQQKTVNIESNGTQIFTPEAGYDAIDQLTVITNVPMQSLQSKSVQITSNGNISVLPDTGYQGMTQVDLTVNVPQGGGSGDVKLFETIAEMQADPNPSEGDLAIVYRNNIITPSPGDTINSITLPATVIFDTAVYGWNGLDLSGSNVMLACSLMSNRFEIQDYTGTISDRIQYTSNDGLTYTRTDSGAETYDLGEDITIPSNANTNILKFLQSRETIFEGLYEYNSTDNEYKIISAQLNATPDYVYEKTFYGKNGVEDGTLPTNVSSSFADINAEIYAKIQQQYDNMQSRVLTDQDKTINKTIKIIPCKSDGTPLLDTSNVTNMNSMFSSCSNLTTIPLLDTSNVTNMSGMFRSCSNLTTIPLLGTSNVTNMGGMFSRCSSLNNESLNNILAMCTNAVKITPKKTLKYIGLTQEQANICTTLSNYQDFVNAGWTTGY